MIDCNIGVQVRRQGIYRYSVGSDRFARVTLDYRNERFQAWPRLEVR